MSFQCPDGNIYSFNVRINLKENRQENIKRAIIPYLSDHYISILRRKYSEEILCSKYKVSSFDELKKIIWKIDLPKYRCIQINKITCHGCQNGILNQLGHSEIGGCLYTE
jgi:hypothetical protein